MASNTGKKKKTVNRKQTGNTVSKKTAEETPEIDALLELKEKVSGLTETNRQLKRKIFDLYTIVEISRNFNAVLDYEALLETFILTSIAQVGATRAVLFLKDDTESKYFKLAISKGFIEGQLDEMYFRENTKLMKQVTKLNRPESVSELILNMATSHEKKFLKFFEPGLFVPLIYQSRLSGVFIIADKISSHDFQLDDIEFLSILGSQISVAIENARLYKAEKMATNQLMETQEKLINSERLAALGEMSAKIAHEINNPLGIIKNYILLLKRSLENKIDADKYATIVGQEIDRIAQIVRELLDFNRPIGIDFRIIDVVDVFDDVLQFMNRQLDKQKIKIYKNYPETTFPIYGSPEGLKQVFMNLIFNAIDAMPDGGQLKIEISKIDDKVKIDCCDSGPGIPDEIVQRIFEPFFTTKDPGKGTGLGLSVCYGIIKRHKGSIRYNNSEDEGGCFEIMLPIENEKK
ncbi:MAG: ATP-binding protein [candidate division Zixibacteria bacterium]|nr:ATP-binding protein [candidate division Zixibacteria bacterium]